LDASTDDVWRALTDPDLLGAWLGSVVALDVRPGGEGVIVEPGGEVRRARIDEVEPARRLALRWWPGGGSGPESTVELDLEETAEGTRLVVTETLVASASASVAGARWGVRLLLPGCCLLTGAVARV
jgi:uncharacterized protein YndB with AHSA1/START domain